MNTPPLPPTPMIPAPAVIVRDVAVAGLGMSALSVLSGSLGTVMGVLAGSLGALLLMGSMAWAVQCPDPQRVMGRVALQWGGALPLVWGLLTFFPAGPVMVGISSLVLGVAVRALLLAVGRTRASEVA